MIIIFDGKLHETNEINKIITNEKNTFSITCRVCISFARVFSYGNCP